MIFAKVAKSVEDQKVMHLCRLLTLLTTLNRKPASMHHPDHIMAGSTGPTIITSLAAKMVQFNTRF
jgi:hypothetical protein